MKPFPLFAIPALTTTLACSSDAPAVMPGLSGKADAEEQVLRLGDLAFGPDAARVGAFIGENAFFGFELAVRDGAAVRLEVTQRGSARGLDTTLFLYGPRATDGAYPIAALASDDDSGYGRLSRLDQAGLASGVYLVVLGTRDGQGQGDFRLEASCLSGDCSPAPTACPESLVAAIASCAESALASAESPLSGFTIYGDCASAPRMIAARDALCATSSEAVCALDEPTFVDGMVPRCERAAVDAWLDATCVFGSRYPDLAGRAEAIVVLGRNVHEDPAGLSVLETQQVLEAVKATAYDEVTTVDEAFEAVDEGRVNQAFLWDASNRAPYVAYEVGAGDNSFGAVFPLDSAVPVATLNDGDFYDCQVHWGPERRPCTADADCRVGACRGKTENGGRCIDASRDDQPLRGQACQGATSALGCPADSGLLCSGASLDDEGLCTPAWMHGVYYPDAAATPVEIPDGGTLEVPIAVYGLASVDTDVRLELLLTHENFAELEVRLVHASGTSVTLYDGARDPAPSWGELAWRSQPIAGFSGDEAVNGTWRLVVTDRAASGRGTLHRVALEVTSRWD
jgi:hypothetical protein